ncbi:hypothetical protein OG563_33620 [Nocardia vinacea]|uniref:Uncharacterized protein n=1 Tax=Nocardia vinacea TaxID=96468 RepID=A0ABZ1YM58_9NOCA|nr:hypothetical protein [Nocardia vinacea]
MATFDVVARYLNIEILDPLIEPTETTGLPLGKLEGLKTASRGGKTASDLVGLTGFEPATT